MRGAAAAACAALLFVACPADSEEPQQKQQQPQGRFGSADAALLVLAPTDVPEGMEFVYDVSGLQNVEQIAPHAAASLRELGFQMGFVQHFGVRVRPGFPPEPTAGLGATILRSHALIFPDDDAARDAIAHLRSNPLPELRSVAVGSATVGPQGYLLSGRTASTRMAALVWRQDNAVLSLTAEAAGTMPKQKALSTIARRVARAAKKAEATGDGVRIPPPVQPGDPVFYDDLEDASGWERTSEDELPGQPLTTYLSGGLRVATNGPGGRWNDTSKFDDGTLGVLDEIVLETDALLLQGKATRWGLMCRVAFAGYYLFVVGDDGFAGIYRAPTRVNNPLPLATTKLDLGKTLTDPHRLRADCAGDPVARLRLYANDELLLEAYDDDPLGPGAVGLWVESREGPAAVLFDNVLVSKAAAAENR